MQVKLAFNNSGDELLFDAVNYEVIEYYVDCLNEHKLNDFTLLQPAGQLINSGINNLHNAIVDANTYIRNITFKEVGSYTDIEYLDQRVLNKLHADWVQSQSCVVNVQHNRLHSSADIRELAEQLHHLLPDGDIVTLGTALHKLNLSNDYNRINLSVHALEEMFNNIKYKTNSWIEFPNPFPKSILTNDISNLRLSFNHLGRTLYNKFRVFDNTLEFNDENTYDQLLGFVSIHLQQPQTIPLSKEYIQWCSNNKVEPSGDFLNVGNLPDINNRVSEYRQLVFRNINNNFKIEV